MPWLEMSGQLRWEMGSRRVSGAFWDRTGPTGGGFYSRFQTGEHPKKLGSSRKHVDS